MKTDGVDFKLVQFPDGQQSIEIIGDVPPSVHLTQSLTNFRDLEVLICMVKALRAKNPDVEISASIPYFLGARSDRRFDPEGLHYLADVICPLVNSLELARIDLLDPHSSVLPALLHRCWVYQNPWFRTWYNLKNELFRDIYVVAPDAGAYGRAMYAAKQIGAKGIVECGKTREISTGKILSTRIPELPGNLEVDRFIIVDDICDGGRTFIELGKALRERGVKKLDLCVTHGIFSQGVDVLLDGPIDVIYTTNSYKDVPKSARVKVFDVQ